ncbi:hypothetical protein H5410_054934 [Solanum commersonii]|uniref:Uncharacterized protein n=1 Tax=Solanum commersonii TaxID=4109 RepID=A0A9J5WII3_SOLCO|nr:hypothetical protein H5410_054934 [Solanum commersonii]
MLYGTDYWLVRNSHVQKVKVAKMRMLKWVCEHTRRDKIRNEDIRNKESRLRWFRHMSRKCTDAPLWRCERLLQLSKDMTLDRRLWRTHIRVGVTIQHNWIQICKEMIELNKETETYRKWRFGSVTELRPDGRNSSDLRRTM